MLCYTTFLPTFHAASTQDTSIEDYPENLPILDTGATRCLLPITWLGAEEREKAKRIHLKVATGTTVRDLLYNNVIYAKSVTRPLINVGQLKGMLDLRMIWDDSSPSHCWFTTSHWCPRRKCEPSSVPSMTSQSRGGCGTSG